MNSEFKFKIYGIPVDGDEAVYEIKLPSTKMEFLMPIMKWSGDEDATYDYLLSSSQLDQLELNESLNFPRYLDLYISCYV